MSALGGERSAGPKVLLAIPAHNEEERIAAALTAALESLASARAAGVVSDGRIAVAAHRCSDRTESSARQILGPDHLVCVIEDQMSVGMVRATLIRQAVGVFGEPDWLLSTDADSQVPGSWVRELLRLGADHDAVAGLVVLSELEPGSGIVAAHDHLVGAGIHGFDRHDHVYAANLGLRFSSYRQAGGFPDVRHGEEHALLAAVRGCGGRVRTSTELTVTTSGRLLGRADHGLHRVLATLHSGAVASAP